METIFLFIDRMCELAPTPMHYWRNHKNIMWSLVVMSLTPVTVSHVRIIHTVTMDGKSTVALANQVCVKFLFYGLLTLPDTDTSIDSDSDS